MRPRHCAQYRRALTRPNSPANGIWVTDSVLQDAFSRYLGSRNHPRCLHSLPGPLEGKRRESKRKISGALSEISFGQPVFPVEFAEGYMSPKWMPPLKPEDRHQKQPMGPGRLFNNVLNWLEDPPPNKPFITPPDDSTTETTRTTEIAGAGATNLGDAIVPVAVAGTAEMPEAANATDSTIAIYTNLTTTAAETNEAMPNPRAKSAARLDTFDKWARKYFTEVYATGDQTKIRKAVEKISFKALPFLQEPPPKGEDAIDHVHRITTVLLRVRPQLPWTDGHGYLWTDAAQLYLHEISKRFMSIQSSLQTEWRNFLLFRIARSILPPHLELSRKLVQPTLRVDLDQKDTRISDVGAQDGCPYWMANIGWLAKASRSMDTEALDSLRNSMDRQQRKHQKMLKRMHMAKRELFRDRTQDRISWWLGWLLWNAYGDFGREPGELRKMWQAYCSTPDISPELSESHLYLMALARLDAASQLSWKDWSVLVSWRDIDTRWYALTEYLMFREQQGRKHLRALGDFWREMGEHDNVKQRILKASKETWFDQSFEGLALALGDHHMALRLYATQQAQGITLRWHWATWAYFAEELMLDPSSDLETVKQLFAFMRKEALAYRKKALIKEAALKVKVIEAMAETVAYRGHHITPSKKWEFFNELLNLHHMLTGATFSKNIISHIVLSMTQLLQTGTMISHRMISFVHHKLLLTWGEETAMRFADTIEYERQQLLRRNFLAEQEERAKLANEELLTFYSPSLSPSSRSWSKDLHAQDSRQVAATLGETASSGSSNRFSDLADDDLRPGWVTSIERSMARGRAERADDPEPDPRAKKIFKLQTLSNPESIALHKEKWDAQVQSAGLKAAKDSEHGKQDEVQSSDLSKAAYEAYRKQRVLLSRLKADRLRPRKTDEGTPETSSDNGST